MYEVFIELLQAKGITPYKLSKETGISQTILSNWKSGRSIPKIDTMKKISEYLDVSIDYLMTGAESASVDFTVKLDNDSVALINLLKNKQLNKANISRLVSYANKLKDIQTQDEDLLQAAHMHDGATVEEIEHDDALMSDESNWE